MKILQIGGIMAAKIVALTAAVLGGRSTINQLHRCSNEGSSTATMRLIARPNSPLILHMVTND